MSFTKAIKKKEAEHKAASHPVDIRKLISGEPLFDDNSVLELTIDQIKNKPQVRTVFDPDYIEALGASMMELGQIQPIIVSPVDDDGFYHILKGECRWRAAKLKGLTVRAIIDPRLLNESDTILGELAENIQRDDLKPLEIANAISGLKSLGMKQGEIAKKLGKNDAFVSRHLKLLNMPEVVQALYRANKVRDVATLNNLIALEKKSPKLLAKVCIDAQTKGLSRKQSELLLKRANEPAKPDHFAHVQKNSGEGFTQGKAGLFTLAVLDNQGREGRLCLDRCDDDPHYVWVVFDNKKERIALNELAFKRVLPVM